MDVTIVVFILVYIAMGFGKLPGFKVDRTGAAIVGALAMMVFGSISAKGAWEAINYQSVGMLFGLMIVSSAFAVCGLYERIAMRVTTLPVSPPMLLAVLVVVGGLLSSLLTNDVVVVAMTPLLVSVTLARGLNPVPFLLAFCFAANTGSSGTLIGSPQNMIVAQELSLSFNGFLKVASLPSLLSLPLVWGITAFMYRGRWQTGKPAELLGNASAAEPTPFSMFETIKAGVVALAVVLAFIFSDWPRELIALSAAGVLLINRKISSKDMLKHVDGDLILLIMGLFVVNAALAATGLPQELLEHLRGVGLDLNEPFSLFIVGGVLSNVVGNNPTVMLLVPYLEPGQATDALGAALALGTGLSSNLIVFGSLAGIIVVEQAAVSGVKISFKEFARAGLPVTVTTMLLAAVWILIV